MAKLNPNEDMAPPVLVDDGTDTAAVLPPNLNPNEEAVVVAVRGCFESLPPSTPVLISPILITVFLLPFLSGSHCCKFAIFSFIVCIPLSTVDFVTNEQVCSRYRIITIGVDLS